MTAEQDELRELLAEIRDLRARIVAAEAGQAAQIARVLPRHRYSATNLVHYVALRSHDMRALQSRLTAHGLSSLGRNESHVLAGIDALIHTLELLAGNGADAPPHDAPTGQSLLAHNAELLLGEQPASRPTRIMVTLPSEAAADPMMVRRMVASGMDIARINCAHDGPEAWAAMVANIRAAEIAVGRKCLVSMDLAGPKLRTGPIQPGPAVLRVKPVRDDCGVVLQPALAWLGARPEHGIEPTAVVIPLRDEGWAGRRRAGETIRLFDARGARRAVTVVDVQDGGCLVSARKTIYFEPGVELVVRHGTGKPATTLVGDLPSVEQSLTVHRGDSIILTKDMAPAAVSATGRHRIGCSLPEVFADARPGERVWLDDGKIGGVITSVGPDELVVEVLSAGVSGTRLRSEKGINFPDTRLVVPAISAQDIEDLAFVTAHADIVALSFVRDAQDVRDLLWHLDPVRDKGLGIVVKIETVAGFEALPQILLEAMRWDGVGIMIARGDLAVEAGFERLAEVQEEILWLCEAAHVPVVWATQVLDTLARTGLPSRAEVTDAAMAERAECVMLNKGPYIDEAIEMLAGILSRMQDHMQKKRSLLRELRAWELEPIDPDTSP
ncbi:pyruvate kinase [soil metagenome]